MPNPQQPTKSECKPKRMKRSPPPLNLKKAQQTTGKKGDSPELFHDDLLEHEIDALFEEHCSA
tara:strand:+ start:690 stop:878 length:189 start_codon:yes stop_codon:yes gene_type:complete